LATKPGTSFASTIPLPSTISLNARAASSTSARCRRWG
jgi:hypothetical protein